MQSLYRKSYITTRSLHIKTQNKYKPEPRMVNIIPGRAISNFTRGFMRFTVMSNSTHVEASIVFDNKLSLEQDWEELENKCIGEVLPEILRENA